MSDDWITVSKKPQTRKKPRSKPIQLTEPDDDSIILRRRPPMASRANRTNLRQGTFQTVARGSDKVDHRRLAKLDNDHENFSVSKLDRNWTQRVQRARQQKGLSQKQLAQKLNLEANLINQYEKGAVSVPDGKVVDKINKFLFN